jgi:hypothetical protein
LPFSSPVGVLSQGSLQTYLFAEIKNSHENSSADQKEKPVLTSITPGTDTHKKSERQK